jgi:hypothetical protein
MNPGKDHLIILSKHSKFGIALRKKSFVNVVPVMELIESFGVFTILAYQVSSSSASKDRGPSLKELLSQSVIVSV